MISPCSSYRDKTIIFIDSTDFSNNFDQDHSMNKTLPLNHTDPINTFSRYFKKDFFLIREGIFIDIIFES